jgi:hypothetical protein
MTSHSAWSGAALPTAGPATVATAGPATVAPTGSRPRGYNGCSPYLYNGMLLRLPRPAAAAAARGPAAALRGARSGATPLQLRRSSAGPGLLGCGGPRGRTAANHCLV